LHLHIHREVPLILGRVPAPPAIALLVRLDSAFEEFAQIIAALHRIGGPDLLAPAMMGLVHADNHGRRAGQCQMIDSGRPAGRRRIAVLYTEPITAALGDVSFFVTPDADLARVTQALADFQRSLSVVSLSN
jgi:hypothetical protein